MKYAGMPFGMWALFAGSFQKQLTAVLGYDAATARAITKKAKPQYRQIIAGLPEFEKADRFKMNLVNCAMVGAFILSMPQRPEVDRMTDYYARSMMTKPMQWFCRKSGKSKFTPKDIAGMKATAALKAADRNPYSWNMEFYEYPDGSGYEGRFTKYFHPRQENRCRLLDENKVLIAFVPAVAVGSAGGKGVLPHKICHTARFAHGVVQTAQRGSEVI